MTPSTTASSTTAGSTATLPGRPLSLRAELRRQLSRRRTLWSFVLLLALPLVIVAAFALGDGDPSEGSLVDLATGGAANFAIFTTAVSSSFLLIVLAALFVGDSLPSEASWSTLRYLLLAPVPRARLLASKLVIGLLSTAVAVVALIGWSLLVGLVFYGPADFRSLSGGSLDWATFGPRLALIAAYLVITLLPVGAIAFALGVRTDAPLAAVGGAVMVTIVSAILDQIDNLGSLRNALPLHDAGAWFSLLRAEVVWDDLVQGTLWSVLYTLVFVGLAFWMFRRKDVLS
ncbi:ABC transporter permease [Nocardioides sp. SOB44]|jgi:ABC-2 type transport system permease protein|uniref:ABC transporter permease n=1 Tax=Nocardioides cremeus TaxID=3058044 RepID=A0ABT8TLL6_9ACTN|nr:ABC transporter permease [Nocardioides cremeus]MDO3394244.1 ABC transporter permease [Nocardioides cremeus]